MAGQRKNEEGTEKPQKKQVGKKKEAEEQEEEKNKFGGLPERDLKKNLGCGG